jgi:hypothetical protein
MLDLSGPFTSPFGERRRKSLPPEARRLNRRAVLLPATLVYGGGDMTLRCTIRNCSDGGARVHVPYGAAIDRELYLIHPRDGSAYWCRVAWRLGQRVGLEFQKKIDLRRPGPEIDFLRKLWLEVQPRPFANCRVGALS